MKGQTSIMKWVNVASIFAIKFLHTKRLNTKKPNGLNREWQSLLLSVFTVFQKVRKDSPCETGNRDKDEIHSIPPLAQSLFSLRRNGGVCTMEFRLRTMICSCSMHHFVP